MKPVAGGIYDKWAVWARHREQLLEALAHCHGTHTEDDVLARIAAGEYHIWDADGEAAVVTFFIPYPQLKAINLFLAGGKAEAIHRAKEGAKRWALLQGCRRAYCGGREGWERHADGAVNLGVILYQEL